MGDFGVWNMFELLNFVIMVSIRIGKRWMKMLSGRRRKGREIKEEMLFYRVKIEVSEERSMNRLLIW